MVSTNGAPLSTFLMLSLVSNARDHHGSMVLVQLLRGHFSEKTMELMEVCSYQKGEHFSLLIAFIGFEALNKTR
jgi:hypothetical protein